MIVKQNKTTVLRNLFILITIFTSLFFLQIIQPQVTDAAENDLNVFYDIFPFRELTVIIDKKLAALIPGADEKFKAVAAAKGVECQTVAYDGRMDKVFKNFPADTDAVLLAGLYRMPDTEKQKLLDHINHLRLPSYGFRGVYDVKLGALACSAPETNLKRRLILCYGILSKPN